jgi:carboxymethylenebutenolidase
MSLFCLSRTTSRCQRSSLGLRPPYGAVEVAVCIVVGFEGGKVAWERIYWDQASILVQIGLLDPGRLPVKGAEQARRVLAPEKIPANELI